MGLFDGFRKKKIAGIIGYLGLENFWMSLTFEQAESMKRYARSSLGANPNGSPVEGNVTFSTATPLQYLSSYIGWAVSDHDYDLADKIIEYCDRIYEKAGLVEKHFYLTNAADCYYKQRVFREGALALAEKYYLKDARLFPEYKTRLMKEIGGILPRIPSFHQLAIIYEKSGRFQEAIDICQLALQYNLNDSTKSGYAGRIEKLQKKLLPATKLKHDPDGGR